MSVVLTKESKVTCGHGGTVATTGVARLAVNGKPVLTKTGVEGASLATVCQTTATSDSSGTPVDAPCTTVMSVTSDPAKKLFVGTTTHSDPVLIADLSGTTNGLKDKHPTADLDATAVQTRLEAG